MLLHRDYSEGSDSGDSKMLQHINYLQLWSKNNCMNTSIQKQKKRFLATSGKILQHLRHVHHSSQYPHFLLFPKRSPLRRRHSAFSFLPSESLRLQHRSPSRCSRPNLFLDDCKSSNSELLQD